MSQSTNMNIVSTNQSMIPTPRLPNEVMAYDAVERAYTALKEGKDEEQLYNDSPYHLKMPSNIRIQQLEDETNSSRKEPYTAKKTLQLDTEALEIGQSEEMKSQAATLGL